MSMKRLVAVAALVLGAALFLLAPAHRAHAQGDGERIESFEVEMTVSPDGSVEFVERIDYDFGTNERHGIFRDIRNTLRFDDDFDRTYALDVQSVESADAPHEFVVIAADDAGDQRVRIGDPDVTVTGQHSYTIRYRLSAIVNAFDPEPDELYWNVTGDDWEVPIERTTAVVHVPSSVEGVRCFAGRTTDAPCAAGAIGPDPASATFSHGLLVPGEELTVVVLIDDTDGATAEPQPILVERDEPYDWSEGFEVDPLTVGTTGALALLFGGLIARSQFRVGRDRRAIGSPTDIAFAEAGGPQEPVPLFGDETNPVEFIPPDGIRPGQLGVLRDEVADTTDVSATIIDLAVRGYLRIEEITDDDGDVDDYRFVRLPKSGGLLGYEEQLLRDLFETGPEVELSALKNKFAKSLAAAKEALYADVVQRGWFDRRPDRVRLQWFLIGIGVMILGGALTFVLGRFTSFGLLGIPVVVAGVALAIGAKWTPRRTPVGHGVYRRVVGFQDFIENSEKHRAHWAERRHLFTEYLPSAIAFGATKQWARTLESLGAPPPQSSGWYVGGAAYGWAGFGDRMSSFTSSTATTLASTPGGSGSSGSSGGFSGGGGGGGGGGSW
jgi:uncharacterized membrane protein YgcG